jgi:hypothetical protein
MKEEVFEGIVEKLAEKPNRLIAMVFLTSFPLLLKFKENTVVKNTMKELADYLETLKDEVPE